VDPKTLNVTLDALKKARTPNTKAVVMAHTLGNPFRADEIGNWCKEEGLYLIEDCCDALGATIGNQPVGSFGEFATLSFYPAHHITMGEGGAVLPADGKWKRVAESIRDWGRDCWCEPGVDDTCKKRYGWKLGDLPEGYDHKYTYSQLGYNLKATDMQAAIGLSQLKKLDGFIQKRRENWAFLNRGIQNSPLLREYLTPAQPTEGSNPSWFGFAMHAHESINRDLLVQTLEKKRIGTRLLFGGNLTKQPAYLNQNYKVAGPLDATDQIMRKTFWIGVHPGLTQPMLETMLEGLEQAITEQRK
jgi:CDP-6-deoxy-D-xylo-4-hexulose-3-dehydrase